MIKKSVICFIIFLLSNSLFSQVEDKLVGRWVYKDIYNRELLDETALGAIETTDLSSMFFQLNSDGTYNSFAMNDSMEGEWILTEDEESFVLKTKATSLIIGILRITDDELALGVGEGEFILSREHIN